MVKAVARAFRGPELLDERHAHHHRENRRRRVDQSVLRGSVLRLTLFAPDIVEAILSGHQSWR
jgi:hypothetical protein